MAARCSKCGQEIGRLLDEIDLMKILQMGTPHREVYRAQKGGWFVNYGGGETSDEAVTNLVMRGEIHKVYSNCNDTYHIGRTWDCERTMAARRKCGKAAPHYYLGDSQAEVTG